MGLSRWHEWLRTRLPKQEKQGGSTPGLRRSSGAEHGDAPQCSCLENPMDRGAWWAAVHGVAKSWTLLKQLQFSSVQSLSHVQLFATQWTAASQASLPITNSWSPPKLMSIESFRTVMLKLRLQYCGHLMRRNNSLENILMLGKIEGERRKG